MTKPVKDQQALTKEKEIGRFVIDAAVRIHRDLGPGLLESVYESVLEQELRVRGLLVERQVPIAIQHRGICFEEGFRANLVVDECIVVELKSVETIRPVHKKQLLAYLRLSGYRLGYLLNFGEALMKDGITRCVNDLRG